MSNLYRVGVRKVQSDRVHLFIPAFTEDQIYWMKLGLLVRRDDFLRLVSWFEWEN